MKNIKPVRLAVIGLGMATKPHLEALTDPACLVEVSGVHNRTRAKAQVVADRYGYHIFESLEDIANDAETEGVIITTPPDQRAEIVEMMARAGKHILMEKPVERTITAARHLVETCEKHGVHFGIVLQHRFRAGAKQLNNIVTSGGLGKIALVRVDVPWWRDQSYYDTLGRGTLERDGGGVLISQAIHVLDLMLSVVGPAKTVQSFCATTSLHKMETEDFATAGIQFVSGAVGSVVATTATFPGGQESITIDGTKGTAILRSGRLQVVWRDGRKEETGELSGTGGGADPMAFPCDWHKDLMADFSMAIRGKRAPRITGREALNVHALIDAIVRSSETETVAQVASVTAVNKGHK